MDVDVDVGVSIHDDEEEDQKKFESLKNFQNVFDLDDDEFELSYIDQDRKVKKLKTDGMDEEI